MIVYISYISVSQHWFMSNRSTVRNLSVLSQLLSEHIDDAGVKVDVFYTAFLKAFDRIDQRLILKKIEKFWILDDLIDLVGSYLSNSPHSVFYNRKCPPLIKHGLFYS